MARLFRSHSTAHHRIQKRSIPPALTERGACAHSTPLWQGTGSVIPQVVATSTSGTNWYNLSWPFKNEEYAMAGAALCPGQLTWCTLRAVMDKSLPVSANTHPPSVFPHCFRRVLNMSPKTATCSRALMLLGTSQVPWLWRATARGTSTPHGTQPQSAGHRRSLAFLKTFRLLDVWEKPGSGFHSTISETARWRCR